MKVIVIKKSLRIISTIDLSLNSTHNRCYSAVKYDTSIANVYAFALTPELKRISIAMIAFTLATHQNNFLYLAKKLFIFLAILLLVSACQTTRNTQPFAWPQGAIVTTSNFKHMVLIQGEKNTSRLHVYIEGDGRPFSNRFRISTDPSPRHPLMLELMAKDKTASLYLGRPCYFTLSNPLMADEQCNFLWWTDARYSDAVVNSMIDALRQHLKKYAFQGVTLIGHSGGGTLAMLMSERMPEVDQLVTLAGNLDTEAWARYHHFTQLRNSLNPATTIKTAKPVKQLHFMGQKDDNIPPSLGQNFLTQIGQQGKVIEGFDHSCCWSSRWQELLVEINQQQNEN